MLEIASGSTKQNRRTRLRGVVSQFHERRPEAATNRPYRQNWSFRKYQRGSGSSVHGMENQLLTSQASQASQASFPDDWSLSMPRDLLNKYNARLILSAAGIRTETPRTSEINYAISRFVLRSVSNVERLRVTTRTRPFSPFLCIFISASSILYVRFLIYCSVVSIPRDRSEQFTWIVYYTSENSKKT